MSITSRVKALEEKAGRTSVAALLARTDLDLNEKLQRLDTLGPLSKEDSRCVGEWWLAGLRAVERRQKEKAGDKIV
jgi:hypothetical protein